MAARHEQNACNQNPNQLPVNDDLVGGIKFSPYDIQILEYLQKKIKNPETLPSNCPIPELINFYECHPRDLLNQKKIAFFFTRPSNRNRRSEIGCWRSRQTERIGKHPLIPDVKVAVKRQLAFYDTAGGGGAGGGIISSGFMMYEYQFDDEEYKRSFLNIEKDEKPPKKKIKIEENSSTKNKEELDDDDHEDWVICEVYGKYKIKEELDDDHKDRIDAKNNLDRPVN